MHVEIVLPPAQVNSHKFRFPQINLLYLWNRLQMDDTITHDTFRNLILVVLYSILSFTITNKNVSGLLIDAF